MQALHIISIYSLRHCLLENFRSPFCLSNFGFFFCFGVFFFLVELKSLGEVTWKWVFCWWFFETVLSVLS